MYRFLVLYFFGVFSAINVLAEIKKEYIVESKNNFEWYLLTDIRSNKKGAADKNGKIIVPIEFYSVWYNIPMGISDIERFPGYFRARAIEKNDTTESIYTQEGKCLFPIGKYRCGFIENFTGSHYLFINIIGKNEKAGILDLNGQQVIAPKYKHVHVNRTRGDFRDKEKIFYITAKTEEVVDIYTPQGNLLLSLKRDKLKSHLISMENVWNHPEKPYFEIPWKDDDIHYTSFYDIKGKHLLTVNGENQYLSQNKAGLYMTNSSDDAFNLNFTSDINSFIPGDNFNYSSLTFSNPREITSTNSKNKDAKEKQPNASGTYTISQQGQSVTNGSFTGVAGPDLAVTIEFFDNYITVGGIGCEYVGEFNGRKKYVCSFMGTENIYYVDGNYNVEKQISYTSPFGTDWFNYKVVKGIVNIPKGPTSIIIQQRNNSLDNTKGNIRKAETGSHRQSCHLCHGSGRCNTCNGTHQYLNPLTGKYIQCPNCKSDGACTACNGTGIKH